MAALLRRAYLHKRPPVPVRPEPQQHIEDTPMSGVPGMHVLAVTNLQDGSLLARVESDWTPWDAARHTWAADARA